MGNMNNRDIQVFFDMFQPLTELFPDCHIKGGKRFIKKENMGMASQILADGTSLPFTPGDFMGHGISEVPYLKKL